MDKAILINGLIDLKKMPVSPRAKGRLVEQAKQLLGCSFRELGRMTGHDHKTLIRWTQFSRITEADYNRLRKSGLSDYDIQAALRTSKDINLRNINEAALLHKVKESVTMLKPFVAREFQMTDNLRKKLDDLSGIVSKLRFGFNSNGHDT